MRDKRKWQEQELERRSKGKTTSLAVTIEAGKKLAAAEEARMTPEQRRRREENRKKYPELAEFVDQLREFFPMAKLIKIEVHVKEDQANPQ